MDQMKEQDGSSMKTKPIVSVIIPTMPNRGLLLKQALNSVKNQTYKSIEIIIVNEGFSSPMQRNIGIHRSKGEFIAFLDDDDIWDSEKIENQINTMNKNCNIGLTYTDVITINSEGKEVERNKSLEWDKRTWVKKRFICWSSVVMRRDVLSKVKKNGFYLDGNLRSADDFDFLIRALKVTKFKRVPGFLTFYRWHENNISHKFIRRTLSVYRIFIKHRMYLCALREVIRHLPESTLKQFGWRCK